jgi:hypothetical protein
VRFDRLSVIILFALAGIQLLPFGPTFVSTLAVLFLVRMTLVMRWPSSTHARSLHLRAQQDRFAIGFRKPRESRANPS